jgi:hypothetical protein
MSPSGVMPLLLLLLLMMMIKWLRRHEAAAVALNLMYKTQVRM